MLKETIRVINADIIKEFCKNTVKRFGKSSTKAKDTFLILLPDNSFAEKFIFR